MDFFESQETARKKTGMLVFYFLLAVTGIVVALYLVAVVGLSMAEAKTGKSEAIRIGWWQPEILLVVAGASLSIIVLGSLYKIFELRAGGERIAEMLGGRQINPNTTDLAQRRLLNIVEEMALASGIPVPPVYLLEGETGINAFAAGFGPGDAVIGVNRGTLEYLSRDELQGVIAHEFSHILNGDMRLNIRLIGILHGILLIAIIGYYMLRFGGMSGRYRRSSSKQGNAGMVLLLVGVAALVIGYVGVFFGRLIKSAVSRQREYLADASAVQFTRNPQGIGGALKKIGGLSAGSRMETPEAESTSHMFFGSAFHFMFGLFSTHPPLVERISRIEPQFDGTFPKVQRHREETPKRAPKRKKKDKKFGVGLGLPGLGLPTGKLGVGQKFPLDPVGVMATIGVLSTKHVDYSSQLLGSMPKSLAEAVRDPFGARAVVFAMLLDDDQQIRDQQLGSVREHEGVPTEQETIKLAPVLGELGESARLPIVELVQSTLRGLSPKQYRSFRDSVLRLMEADQKISLFEFVLGRVILLHLDRHFSGKKPPTVRYRALRAVLAETVGLISSLAHIGHSEAEDAARAFDLAFASLRLQDSAPVLLPKSECNLPMIDQALEKLSRSTPPIKKRVLSAVAVCVAADGQVTVAEAELLRAIADSLDCPMPPILASSIGKENVAP